MATPLRPPPPYEQQPPPYPYGAPPPYGYYPPQAAPLPERPGGVTFAGVLAIIYGALAAFGALMVMLFASVFVGFFQGFPWGDGSFSQALGAAAVIVAFFIAGLAALLIHAGMQVMKGKSWARWTLVVVFALGALNGFGGLTMMMRGGMDGVPSLLFPILDVVAIVLLLNAPAKAWFDAMEARDRAAQYAPPPYMPPPPQ